MCLNSTITKFEGITLAQMDAVKLMNRTDRKYWFSIDLLEQILEEVAQEYYLLEVEGERNMPYATTYYDTLHDDMYRNHHRGKMNRYKIRRRNYVSSGISFLEVKFKSNKGRTVKVRRASEYDCKGFNNADSEFIGSNTPYSTTELTRVLENGFRRLMLVSKSLDERCTIDSELHFVCGDRHSELGDLVVVEVKTDGRSHSAIIDALNRHRIKPSGFSKYCMGRSITEQELIKNRFKRKHREIVKKINNVNINS